MIRLTPTGKVFFGICVLFYFASLSSQSSLLLTVIGLLLGCFVINFLSAWRAVRQVDVLVPNRSQIAEGERLSQPWKMTNRGPRTTGFLHIESDKQTVLRVASLPPGASANTLPELAFTQRGVHLLSQMKLTSVYPFGLLRAGRKLELAGEVVVHPAIYHTSPPRAAGYDIMVGGKFRGKHRVTTGTHFAGVRPMQPGDSLKQIHWKSSAKGQGLMVKTFEEELSGRVTIIMDAGHSGDKTILDNAVRAAGSLLFAALDRGDHLEWVDLANLELLLIPPFADGDEILERLARLPMEKGCLQADRLRKAIDRISRKSAVCLILTDWNEAAESALHILQKRNQRAAVYVPIPCPARSDTVPFHRFGAREITASAVGSLP